MKAVLCVAWAGYMVSWFLPVVDFGIDLDAAGQEMTKAFEDALNQIDPSARVPDMPFPVKGVFEKASIRGYDAAERVFDSLREAFKDRAKPGQILDLIWCNLANPLFLIAGVLSLIQRWRAAGAMATIAALSAARWLFMDGIDASDLGPGYWMWLASIALGAFAYWRTAWVFPPNPQRIARTLPS